MLELIKQPWPWYVAEPLIGLTVPALLILGNKSFGISGTLRNVCASCMPANIPFLNMTEKEIWNWVLLSVSSLAGSLPQYF